MGDVLTVLPFQNTVATFKVPGKTIVGALEHGVSGVEEGKGQFPQVAGLKYAFDKSAPANGGRVKSVEVMEGGQWKPIDPAKEYIVASNNYVRQGGDGYKLFVDAKDAYDYGPSLEQVVADYVGTHSPYTPKLDGRITELAAATQPAAATEAAKPADTAQAGGTAAPAAKPADAASSETAKPAEAAKPVETAKPAETAAPIQAGGTHTIVKGDTYWDIAVKAYGDGTKWRRIANANPGQEAHRLLVGSELKIPAK